MSHTQKKHLRILSLLSIGMILTVSFQNCSSSVQFDGDGGFTLKNDGLTLPSEESSPSLPVDGDDVAVDDDSTDKSEDESDRHEQAVVPPPVTPDETDSSIPISGPDGCNFASGQPVFSDLNSPQLDSAIAENIDMISSAMPWVIHSSSVVNVTRFHGTALIIKQAALVPIFSNVYANTQTVLAARTVGKISDVHTPHAKVRAGSIDEISNIHPVSIGIAAGAIGTIKDVFSSQVCVHVNKLGLLTYPSGGGAVRIEVRGYGSAGATPSRLETVQTISTASLSIHNMNVGKLNTIYSPNVVIKNAQIDELSDINGHVTLINSTLTKRLHNFSGTLILKNSKIGPNVVKTKLESFRIVEEK